MEHASSYAVGGSQLTGLDRSTPLRADDGTVLLPPQRPHRMHWSTLLFVSGMAVCALGLLATIAGVPGKVGYDIEGAPDRNKPTSNDPLALTKSLDGNMKWVEANSADGKGTYVGYIKSINRSEAAIPAMVQALVTMDASVRAIDTGLAEVGTTTKAMRAEMAAMAEVSTTSGATMGDIGEDIGFLSSSMLQLASSTKELTTRMQAIERTAGGIAANGTAAALSSTKELNASLPSDVPAPLTTDGVPLAQAMAELATRGGGAAEAADGAPDSYVTGAAP